MKADDTAPVRPGAHTLFLGKAKEFARGMEEALGRGDVNQATSSAAHCVISAVDAVCAQRLHVRSRARRHEGALGLVESMPIPGAREKAVQAGEVLSLKHRSEYDDRDVSTKDAEHAVKQARRFLEWAEAAIRKG